MEVWFPLMRCRMRRNAKKFAHFAVLMKFPAPLANVANYGGSIRHCVGVGRSTVAVIAGLAFLQARTVHILRARSIAS